MPFVEIMHVAGALTFEQKRKLILGVQDAVVAVEGEAMRAGVGVAIQEAVAAPDLALNCMPFVSVTLLRDALTPAQRRDMAAGIVEAVVAVEGEARRDQTWVVVKENVASGEWSVGGHPLTLDALSTIKAGRNPWA